MEILAAIVGAVAQYTVGPIIRQGGYIIHCKRNIQTLQTRVEELKAARGRVDVKIHEADRKGEHIYDDVKQWITKIDEIAGKADELLNDEHQAKMNCMHGFCPNLLTRHQLSRKSTKLVEVVLEQEKVEFSSISYGGRTGVVFLKDYEAFDSRSLTLNRIMDELKNPDINKIGVYGIAGVGKTTLAEEVVRQVKDKLFDDVVVVRDVKEYPDIERIQKEIAEQLGMDYSNDLKDLSRTAKASRIYDRLKDKKTFLVLDDIWNFFDLKVVGLPDVATCKILLTSRSGVVLSTEMGTQINFQLFNLEEQECWSLFESKVGDVVRDPMIRTVATQVAKKCGGLPILVVTVASALKKCTLPEWEDALRRLETFQNTGSIKQAFSALEWIYDKLDDEELQSLFLLCGVATWENSIFLDDLLKLAVGLDLLKGVNTMKEARNSLLSLVKKLKFFCLLLDDNGDTSVRMHDLVNDVATEIASRDQQLLSVACGAELKDWPKTSKCGKISIKSDSLAKLSEVLVCQKLEMFHLHCEDEQPLQVPNGLFANMEKLKVLSLMNVKNLASLGFLKNLQTLCLDKCKEEDIAVVGKLSKLEILSLEDSNIKELPKEIGQLNSLRLLDLTSCYSLEVIAPNVLSRLTRLEDLRMRYSSIKWEAEQEGERSNASLSELKHLSLLTALEIQILNPDMLPKDLFSDKLERFYIRIGDHYSEGRSMNTLKLQFTTGFHELDQGLKMMVKRSEDLTLQGGVNVNETAYRLEGDNFRQLKHLQLRKLDTTYIINSKVVFSSLTTLEVTNCDGIKFLFSSSTARSLVQLKTLEIRNCRSMVVIVSTQEDDEENNIVDMFSKLESLTLRELPSLVRFCSGSYAGFSSLQEALISNGKSKSTTITKEIEDGDSKDHLGVDNAVNYFLFDKKVVFSSLTTLEVTNCDGIKFLFSSSTARSLVQLKTLEIRNCRSMVVIVSTQEDDEENNIVDMFSKLESLTLRELPSLVGFCSGSYAGFSSLEEALISDGQSNSTTITKEIEDGDSKDHLGVDNAVHYFLFDKKVVFSSLTTLEVTNCDGIKFLFSSSTARSLVQLKTLEIRNCRSMVVIVSTQEDDEENNIVDMFSKLESLTLRELPSLVGFCSGSYAGFSSLEEALISDGQSNSTTITKEIEDGDSKDHLGVDNAVLYFLFDEKVTFPCLEILRLEKLPKLEAVWQNQLAPESFSRLKQVEVRNCSSLINLFVPCITETLDALETLGVWFCPSLEVVFKCGGLKFEETHDPSTKELKTFNYCPNLKKFIIQGSDKLKYIFQTEEWLEIVPKFVFPKVTKVQLFNLPQFKSIYPGTHVSQWPSLQELNVKECGEVEIIVGELSVYQEKQESASHSNPIEQPLILIEKVVFSNLTTLEVTGCHGIKFLLSSSMAISLVQLRTLEISNCRSMVVIVSTQEDDEENNIVDMFSKLESLTLRELPSLVGFCSGSYTGFSSSEEALISDGQSNSTTITKEIEDGDSKDHLGVDNAVHYFLFDEKVTFSCLEILRLEKLPKLEAVWQNQLAPDSFCRIRKVEVESCPSLINLFVPCIMERLDALETLSMMSCLSLEVVFKCGGLKFKETHDPSTKELKTFNCCPNLEYFSIQRSDKLKYIFQTEERLETVPKFVFPKVTKLLLSNLPQFKSIYPGTHVSQWPSLQELYVDECGEVKIIAGELSVYQEKQESASHSNPIEQPLILIEKGSSLFASLEGLFLGAIEMWSGPPPAQFCSKVKLVAVRGATFSKHATFLQRLHNLEKNFVGDMEDKDPCREIFVDEGNSGGEIHPVGIFPQVRTLKLHSLKGIMHIGTESSQSAVPVFPKLERLQVWDCSELKNLDSSTISFQNLTALTVDSLDGLKYLVSHRIARSLMQLTRLKIRNCKRMEVIVATEEDDDELAFSRLKHLELRRVPHLRGLCSGNCILKFPSLETLTISRRLKSKLFSHDEIRCQIDYNFYDTDVEDAPADDEDGGDDNEVNDDGHGNDKKDDSACDAKLC